MHLVRISNHIRFTENWSNHPLHHKAKKSSSVCKLQNFTLTIFEQTFRETNGFPLHSVEITGILSHAFRQQFCEYKSITKELI